MKNTKIGYFALCAAVFAPASFAATAYINQIGYRTSDTKELVLFEGNGKVDFVDASGTTVLSVEPATASNWVPSGQQVQLVDFSALKDAGTYTVKQNGQVLRSDLKVGSKVYENVTKAALKWFYYQRASMALDAAYAGKWARAAGHVNSTISLYSDLGSGSIESTKGWYDAGDFGRYIVNSGITTYTLLSLYEHFPKYFKNLKWNIPADGSLPDILAEIKWNLDWMLTMQASDGGVYHKITAVGFPGDIMPADDDSKLYVVGKGAAASFDFAAVMAVASRVYKDYDATYASKCLEAAKKAFAWGTQNFGTTFKNPSGISTGEYGDVSLGDEKIFAGTELYISTGDASYKQDGTSGKIPSWGDVSGLAVYGTATHATEFGGDAANAKQTLVTLADEFVNRANTGFGVVMSNDDFVWGSNAVAANQGVWLLHAFYLTGEKKYYETAKKVLDYLLGKNPLDMSFVTGYGTKSPLMPHHRPSTADNVEEPIPGMLVGGPQPAGEDVGSAAEWKCSDYRTGHAATSYTDQRCSYATNEVAINWNAPLAYLAGAIEALNAGESPVFAVGKLDEIDNGTADNDGNQGSQTTDPNQGNGGNQGSQTTDPNQGNGGNQDSQTTDANQGNGGNQGGQTADANQGNGGNQGGQTADANQGNGGNQGGQAANPNQGQIIAGNNNTGIAKPANSNRSTISTENAIRFRMDGQRLVVEKNGKLFDLKGMRIH